MSQQPNGPAVTPEDSHEESGTVTQSGGTETVQLSTGNGSIEEVAAALEAAEKPDEGTPEEESPEETQEETPEEKPEQTIEEELATRQASDKELSDKLSTAGISFDALADEYQSTGDISKESREKLAAAGYSENFVNSYIAGQVAVEQKFIAEVQGLVGGEKEFNSLLQFAKTNLSQKEADAFDKAIESGDMGLIGLSLTAIKAKQQAKYGTANKALKGAVAPAAPVKGFKNTSEMTKAMGDKRYGRDAAYTNEVMARVGASNF